MLAQSISATPESSREVSAIALRDTPKNVSRNASAIVVFLLFQEASIRGTASDTGRR